MNAVRAFDVERELREIANGLRMQADVRESDADALTFGGDLEGAARLRRAAAYLREKAAAVVEDLARVYRARVTSPAYQEATSNLRRLTAADWQAEREQRAERLRAAEARVAARRRVA